MSWGLAFDVLLVAVAALSQSASAWLGWRVTVRGVPASKKREYEILFVLCAALGVLATVGIAYRGGNIGKDLEAIKHTQGEQGKELHKIEENTKQPPQVIVNAPPTAKPRAIMGLSKDTSNDGITVVRDPRFPQNGWAVNVSCKNIGTIVTAKKVVCAMGGNRIPAYNGVPDNKTLQEHWDEFSKWLSKERPPQSVDLDPGRNVWGSAFLNMTDVDPALNTGQKVIWIGGAILYSDSAGPHKKEFCMWAQPPFDPPNTAWHFCAIGHNKDVY